MFIWTPLEDIVSVLSLRTVNSNLPRVKLGPHVDLVTLTVTGQKRQEKVSMYLEIWLFYGRSSWAFRGSLSSQVKHRNGVSASGWPWACVHGSVEIIVLLLFFFRSPHCEAAVESWLVCCSWLAVWGLCHYSGHLSSEQEFCNRVEEVGMHKWSRTMVILNGIINSCLLHLSLIQIFMRGRQ